MGLHYYHPGAAYKIICSLFVVIYSSPLCISYRVSQNTPESCDRGAHSPKKFSAKSGHPNLLFGGKKYGGGAVGG